MKLEGDMSVACFFGKLETGVWLLASANRL